MRSQVWEAKFTFVQMAGQSRVSTQVNVSPNPGSNGSSLCFLCISWSLWAVEVGEVCLCSIYIYIYIYFSLDSEVVITLEMSMCFLLKKGVGEAEGREKKFNLSGWRKYKLHLTLPIPFQSPPKIKRETNLFEEWRML